MKCALLFKKRGKNMFGDGYFHIKSCVLLQVSIFPYSIFPAFP